MELKFIEREDLSKLYPDTKVLETAPETPIRFCFVGAKGVGKTSLLTSMYQQIKAKKIDSITIDDNSTARLLNDTYADMLEAIDDTDMNAIVDLDGGIKGTQYVAKYCFLGKQMVEDTDLLKITNYKKFRFRFEFTDMPGGWYDLSVEDGKAKAKENLLNSTASFLAIDAPYLMASRGSCVKYNYVNIIEDWYRDTRKQLGSQKHTVIMVITRCEKYWSEQELMIENVKDIYGEFIKGLKEHGIEVYLTWIKTLGGVEFSHFEQQRDEKGAKKKIPRFIRTGEYEPENCNIPLQLALEHGLTRAIDRIPTDIGTLLGLNCQELAQKAAHALAENLRSITQKDAGANNFVKF